MLARNPFFKCQEPDCCVLFMTGASFCYEELPYIEIHFFKDGVIWIHMIWRLERPEYSCKSCFTTFSIAKSHWNIQNVFMSFIDKFLLSLLAGFTIWNGALFFNYHRHQIISLGMVNCQLKTFKLKMKSFLAKKIT